ncbi:MAG: FG-GAP repeat domain-containing protein, partial [Planctomycetota bacterium]
MKRTLYTLFQTLGLARPLGKKLRQRRRYLARLEQLERREVFAADPILMGSGADLSSAEFSVPHPDPDLVWTYHSAGILSKDAYGNKIDFNQDGYGDTLQIGRVDEIVDYKQDQLTACSRTGFAVAHFGGPGGALVQNRNGGDLACGGFAHLGVFAEVTAIDLNQDGYEDLLGLSNSVTTKGTEIRVRYWNPTTQSVTDVVSLGNIQAWGAKFASWQFGDVNGDGVLDMVTPNFDSVAANNLLPYIGFETYLGIPNGSGKFDGHFQATPWATVAARTPVPEWGIETDLEGDVSINNPSITPVLADLNGDGKLDLAIPEIDGMSVFTNPGNGQFVSGTRIFTAVPTGSHGGPQLKAGDLDQDSDLDLVDSPNLPRNAMLKRVGTSLYDWQPAPGSITVFQNQSVLRGTIAFASSKVVGFDDSQGGYNGQLEIADLNLDGKLDLVVASAELSTKVYGTLAGNGDGTFGTLRYNIGYADDDGTGTIFHRGIRGIAAIDSNNDGLIDIATAATYYGTIAGDSRAAVDILGVSLNKTYRAPTVVVSPSLPVATQGKPYSYQLTSSGGNPNEPY